VTPDDHAHITLTGSIVFSEYVPVCLYQALGLYTVLALVSIPREKTNRNVMLPFGILVDNPLSG
jgi:hypothetical protein